MKYGIRGYKMIEFEGLDTETVLGYANIIATSKEYRNINTFDEILDFLFQDKYHKKIFMLWNLRYDSQAILKFLFNENYDDWYKIGKEIQSFEGYIYNDKYKIVYIPGKLFKIGLGKGTKHIVKMYDIAQYYDWKRLENMSQMYLGTSKQDTAKWIEMSQKFTEGTININQLKSYFKKHNAQIGLYCQDDALKTLQLTEFKRKSFKSFGYPFDNPLSSAKLAELYETRNYLYPRITDKMNKTHEFVKQSFHGGMFESRIRGLLEDEIHEYDINSAYPYELSKLEHLGNGKLWKVQKPTSKANMGWYICDYDSKYIPYKKDIPHYLTIILDLYEGKKEINIKNSNTSSFYCTGIRRQIITKIEYDFLIKHNIKVICHGGVEWYKENDKYEKPFGWIIDTFDQRKELKNFIKNNPGNSLNIEKDINQLTLKKMLNSLYGKTAQQKHGYSKMTNFFYSSYVTAGCRIKMCEIAINNENNIIEIATDGIYSNKDLHIKDDLNFGGYESNVYEKGLFLGSGMKQLFADKKNFFTKIRGISNNRSLDLIDVLKKNKSLDEIVFWKTRPIHLNECIVQLNKRSLYDLNLFQKVGRKLSVNTDKKHAWSINYNNFKELLKTPSYGSPLTVNEVNGIYQDYLKDVNK